MFNIKYHLHFLDQGNELIESSLNPRETHSLVFLSIPFFPMQGKCPELRPICVRFKQNNRHEGKNQ
jgi:hypothetical protein